MDFLHSWAVVLGQIFRQIVSIRVMTLINTNVVASRHIKREEVLLPVAVRRGNENVTHSAQSEFSGRNGFFGGGGGIFCLEYPSRRSEKLNCHFLNYRLSFRKLQILISQTADIRHFHFANYKFSFRFVPFRFVSFRSGHFVSQTTVSHCQGHMLCFSTHLFVKNLV